MATYIDDTSEKIIRPDLLGRILQMVPVQLDFAQVHLSNFDVSSINEQLDKISPGMMLDYAFGLDCFLEKPSRETLTDIYKAATERSTEELSRDPGKPDSETGLVDTLRSPSPLIRWGSISIDGGNNVFVNISPFHIHVHYGPKPTFLDKMLDSMKGFNPFAGLAAALFDRGQSEPWYINRIAKSFSGDGLVVDHRRVPLDYRKNLNVLSPKVFADVLSYMPSDPDYGHMALFGLDVSDIEDQMKKTYPEAQICASYGIYVMIHGKSAAYASSDAGSGDDAMKKGFTNEALSVFYERFYEQDNLPWCFSDSGIRLRPKWTSGTVAGGDFLDIELFPPLMSVRYSGQEPEFVSKLRRKFSNKGLSIYTENVTLVPEPSPPPKIETAK